MPAVSNTLYLSALAEMRKKKASPEKARRLLERSLARGDPSASYALGTWYLHGTHVKKDLKKAIRLLRQAAVHGHADASYDLAVSYEMGTGVKKNQATAAQHYLRAALLGDLQAMYEVGRCYFHGIGFNRDRRCGRIWLDHAKQLAKYKGVTLI